MPSVKVKENESVDIAIRRFKRACEKAGVLSDVRKREFYEIVNVNFMKSLPKLANVKKQLR